MNHRKLHIVALIGLIVSLWAAPPWTTATHAAAHDNDWQVQKAVAVPDHTNLLHLAWQSTRPPYGPHDRITLHLLKNISLPVSNRKVILMLPGTWQSGGWTDITNPTVNPMIHLALNGYDVYTMDYRAAAIPDMAYDQLWAMGIDINPAADWNYGVYREDVKACVDKIKTVSAVDKIFMSGFSRGGMISFIYASKYPQDLLGLISFDGIIKDFPPFGEPLDETAYQQVLELFKAGLLPDPDTGLPIPLIFEVGTAYYPTWKLAGVLPLTRTMTDGPLPPEFETVSDFVANDAYLLYGPGVFTNYPSGTIDRDMLVSSLNASTRYHPTIHNLEDIQLFAHEDVPYFDYDDNQVDLPAIAFMSPLGCPEQSCLIDIIPNMTINPDVTIHYLPAYGHVDILYGTNSLADIKTPLLNWLNAHQTR